LWYSGNRFVRLKYIQHKTARLYQDLDSTKEEMFDIINRVHSLSQQISNSDTLKKYMDIIEEKCPLESELEMGELKVQELVKIKALSEYERPRRSTVRNLDHDINLKSLVDLHYQLKEALQSLQVANGQWNETIDDAIELEDLIASQKSDRAPAWNEGVCHALLWRYHVLYEPILFRVFAVFCALLSFLLLWCQVTIFNKGLSPINALITTAQSDQVSVQVCGLVPLTYICVCALFPLFRARFGNYYHINGNRRTGELSLLYNASYGLRLTAPLGFIFVNMLTEEGTAFQGLLGKMDVIPFFGTKFTVYFPVMTTAFCLCTLFNVYGRILRVLQITRFEYSENFEDDLITEGKMLLRKERRKRGLKLDQTLL